MPPDKPFRDWEIVVYKRGFRRMDCVRLWCVSQAWLAAICVAIVVCGAVAATLMWWVLT